MLSNTSRTRVLGGLKTEKKGAAYFRVNKVNSFFLQYRKATFILCTIKYNKNIRVHFSDNVQFDEQYVKISPNSAELPASAPVSYKVCGKVTLSTKNTLHHRKVAVQKVASTFYSEIESDPNTGDFCIYLGPGKYQLNVFVSDEEKKRGLQ